MGQVVNLLKPLKNESGFIFAAIAWLGTAVIAAVGGAGAGAGVAIAAGIAVQAAAIGGLLYLGSEILSGLVPDMPGSLDPGLLTNKQSANEPIPVVVGTRRVGGTIVFYETSGVDNIVLHLVCVLSEGEVESIENVYFNDIISTDARWGSQITHFKHTGSDSQTYDTDLTSEVPRWTSAHRLRGIAYVYVRLVYDPNTFFAGVPTITADVKGVKCYDTRTSTTIWSDNPAVIIRNYLINTRYGRGIDSALIDDTSFETAANFCDELVTFNNIGVVDGIQAATATVNLKTVSQHLLVGDTIKFNGHATEYVIDTWADGVSLLGEQSSVLTGDYKTFTTTTMTLDQSLTSGIADDEAVHKKQKRYNCNGVISTDKTSMDIIKEMLTSCRGMLIFTGGQYKLIIDKTQASTFSFDASNIIGAWTISQGSKSSQFNRISINYFDPWREWQATTEVVDSTTYRTADNELMLERDITLPFTADANTARQIATINLQQSRQQVATEFTATIAATEVEVGDVVDMTHATPGWTSKEFRVLRMSLMNNDEIRMTVREYDATVYDFGSILDYDATPNTNLPDPYDINQSIPLVGDVSLAEENYDYMLQTFTRLKVTLTPPDWPWFKHIEAWVSVDGQVTYKHFDSVVDDFTIDPVGQGITYYVKLIVVNFYGAKGDSVIVSTTIQGKSAVPTSLTSLDAIVNSNTINLYSTKVADPDVEIYEFRLGASWDGAIFLASLRSPNYSLYGVKPGSHTFWANSLSTNGEYGATPRSASATLIDPPDGWSVTNTETCDYNGVGTHSNTEYVLYGGNDSVKCSHTADVLVGTYTSPTYDRGSSARYLVYVLADIVVTGAGTTWGDQFPSPTTWADQDVENRTWAEIFELPAAPSVEMTLLYGDADPPTNEVNRMELMSTIVTARYYRVKITITDPALTINAIVNDFTLKFCQ